MKFRLNIIRSAHFVSTEVAALALVEEVEPLFAEVERETRRHADRRLFLDLRGVVGTLGTHDHIHLGQLIAHHLPHLEKVASLVPEKWVEWCGVHVRNVSP